MKQPQRVHYETMRKQLDLSINTLKLVLKNVLKWIAVLSMLELIWVVKNKIASRFTILIYLIWTQQIYKFVLSSTTRRWQKWDKMCVTFFHHSFKLSHLKIENLEIVKK